MSKNGCYGKHRERRRSRGNVRSVAVVPIRTAQPNKKATIEMQLGDLQVKFNESPTAEQLKVVLRILLDANQPVC